MSSISHNEIQSQHPAPVQKALIEHSIDYDFKPDFNVSESAHTQIQMNIPKLRKMLT